MIRVAAVLWIVIGTAVAGTALMFILVVPQLADQATRLIPIVCGASFVLAMPLSWLVAKRVQTRMRPA
jgi:hypothetical protein